MFVSSNIEESLAYLCAPCFAGLKPANLISISMELYKQLPEMDMAFLNEKAFYIKELCLCEKCAKILVYNKKALEELFLQEEFCNAIELFGYSIRNSPDEILDKVAQKIKHAHSVTGCKRKELFPHEIGLFLGYPIYDVLEYYKRSGRDSILTGYWKVYSSPEQATKIFSQYNACKEHFALQIQKGFRLYDLLRA